MKTISLFFAILLFAVNIFSQDISERWGGMLEIAGQKSPFSLTLKKMEMGSNPP
jgi:hypothetical protein